MGNIVNVLRYHAGTYNGLATHADQTNNGMCVLQLQAQAVGEAAGAAAAAHNDSDAEQTKTVARRFLAEQVNINVAEELHISAGILSR